MYKEKKVTAVIGAAGQGKRVGGSIPKQFLKIAGDDKTIIEKSVEAFEKNEYVDDILVVTNQDFILHCEKLLSQFKKVKKIVSGGKERQDSIYQGLKCVEDGIVLVHDAARPFVSQSIIKNVIEMTYLKDAVVPGVPVKDTVRFKDGLGSHTLDRSKLFNVQTPQGFERNLLLDAYQAAYKEGYYGTDDSSLVERLGQSVEIVEGSYENYKVTTKEDLNVNKKVDMRIGSGYDVHRLVEGRKLILCGVEIPFEKGLLGHSDADVATHALMDALLGAAALGDIGKHFPDSHKQYEGISSLILLDKTMELLKNEGFSVGNIDLTIIAQRPKISSYINDMREILSTHLGIDISKVNVKATTTEGLGFTGRQEGIAAEAVCILYR